MTPSLAQDIRDAAKSVKPLADDLQRLVNENRNDITGAVTAVRSSAERVNDLLNADLPDDRFVTAFVGLLEPAEHRFSYISAGQGPVFHFTRSTGEVREMPTSGLPLGVMPGRGYELSRAFDEMAGCWLWVALGRLTIWSSAASEASPLQRRVRRQRSGDDHVLRIRG